MQKERDKSLPHVVIVGAGFGGLVAATVLARAPVRITIIDRNNHHLFQPLLYQVATAGLSPADIAAPVRHIIGRERNVSVLMETVTGVDTANKAVLVSERRISYDWLIVATGATHAYPKPAWAAVAPGLKSIEDATAIRAKILRAFEQAETSCDPVEQRRLMTFVIVGGGPTGVEMAGAIAEIAKRALAREFKNIDPRSARILLIEGADRVLTAFPPDLSDYAAGTLRRLGVEVRLGDFADAIDDDGVDLAGERIPAATVIWAAGVKASPAGAWLDAETDRAGRVAVTDALTVPGQPDIFVVGDTAAVMDAKGEPVPGIAPAAKQMGKHAAETIKAHLYGSAAPGPFRYRHMGNLATIGRSSAVIHFGRLQLRGWLAWMIWGVAHIWFLIGFRNKLVVMADWFWAYLTFKKGMRLITGGGDETASSGTCR